MFFKRENQISNIIKEKLKANNGKALMPTLRGAPIAFWISPTGMGIETDKLPGYILEWEHFDEIVKKANALGGTMYRADVLANDGVVRGFKVRKRYADAPFRAVETATVQHHERRLCCQAEHYVQRAVVQA